MASTQVVRRRAVAAVGRTAEPTVAFLDAGRWESFDQLAALLRRRGCRCVRITTERSLTKRLMSRVLYHRVIGLSVEGMARWLASSAAEAVWDFQLTDEVYAALTALPAPLQLPARPATPSTDWLELVHDKRRQFAFFNGHGIPQPDQLPVAEVGPEEAAATLGLPLMVKPARGSGGQGVRQAATVAGMEAAAAQAAAAVAHGEVSTHGLLWQQFIPGDEYGYGCAAIDGRVVQQAAYRKVPLTTRPFGQAVEVTTVGDPELLALGRAVAAALHVTGMMAVDFVRDPDGVYRFIDLHPRPWGCFAALSGAGIDLSEGYLSALGAGPEPAPPASPPTGAPSGAPATASADRTLASFPTAHHDRLVGQGMGGGRVRAYRRAARAYRKAMGRRYWLETVLLTSIHVGRRRPRARRRSRAER